MAFLCLRYVELNTKLQASFRRYNSAIPSYLRERPHHIILTVNATTNTNLAQQNKKHDEVEFLKIPHRSAPKAGKFHLSEQDISTISTGDWLTDHIVGAAQSVLREQFPHARGLENTTLGPIFNFSVQKGQFSQILNTGSHHWVLVSTVGCYTPSVVYLYDSLFSGRIAALVQKQIASIIYEEGTSFKVIVPNVQHQNNSDDCGVYAIAFLVSLLHGLNPSNLTFDRKLIRQHLLKSLESGSFDPPLSKVPKCRDGRPLFVQEVSVMCECRMPREESDSKSPSRCVKCCSCKEFFHRKCISTIILEDSSANWRCPNCERALKQEEKNNH